MTPSATIGRLRHAATSRWAQGGVAIVVVVVALTRRLARPERKKELVMSLQRYAFGADGTSRRQDRRPA